MKCENCGKNEVTFYYKSNVNGKVTEKHLCSECAEKLGYTQNAAAYGRQMMRGLWDGSLLDSFFAPLPRLLGGMDSFGGEGLFDDFFDEMPALCAAPSGQEESAAQEDRRELVDSEEQSRFSRMRELNALRLEMKKAVHQEDFEHAAQLRDQIRALEQKKQENG